MTDTTSEHAAATGGAPDARPAPTEPAPHTPRPGGAPPHGPGTGPAPAPTVPRPRRSPTDRAPVTPPTPAPAPAAPIRGTPARRRGTRRPTGPAGRGPGSSGSRGPTRTPYLARTSTQRRTPATPDTPDIPLPTPGARHRALENRPHLWFAHQLLLALSDQRPVHALLGHALPAAYDRLAELAPHAPLRPYVAPGLRAPVPALHACGLCRPRDGVIEAFARITTGARLRALAFRLERGADARWRCAALDLGPVP
ncbi:Rv3235 family protein [Streptomyces lunalinharesii]|uniref:Translation initiation factor IF-2 n=1 Tax=Streptomyces lunalinharesii TaxID=333384 RepID=A0ABN3SFA2_9ACTN